MKKLIKKILPPALYASLRKSACEIIDAHEKKNRYSFIAVDITSNCNLRCPFCLNDFSQIHGNTLMTEENLEKAAKLLPLVYADNFFISCLYEPFLHPDFVLFLEKIPWKYRKRVFFTTNLTLSVTDETFRRLSRLNLSHINISLDSFQPGLYEKLRKGAKFERFKDNLERMVKIFSREAQAAPLRYITVVLKENYPEIPSIIETCHRDYLSSGHELRYVQAAAHHSLEWKQENLISNRQWAELEEFCAKSSFKPAVTPPPPVYFPGDCQDYSRTVKDSGKDKPDLDRYEPPFGLNIDSAGRVSLFGNKEISFDLSYITDPYKFFKKKRRFLRSRYKAVRNNFNYYVTSGAQGDAFREKRPPGPPAKASDKVNKDL